MNRSATAQADTQAADIGTATLDGRRFDGLVLIAGQSAGDADTLIFDGGRFRSTACDRWGYGDGAYVARIDGTCITFEAETESAQYGRLRWHGTVSGTRLDGCLTMLRDGVATGEKWVIAADVSAAAPAGAAS